MTAAPCFHLDYPMIKGPAHGIQLPLQPRMTIWCDLTELHLKRPEWFIFPPGEIARFMMAAMNGNNGAVGMGELRFGSTKIAIFMVPTVDRDNRYDSAIIVARHEEAAAFANILGLEVNDIAGDRRYF